jgi:hypothetical protein
MLQHTKTLEAAAVDTPGSTPSSGYSSENRKRKKKKKKDSPPTVESIPSAPEIVPSGPESIPSAQKGAPPQPAAPLDYDSIPREAWRQNLPKDQVHYVDVPKP